MLIEEWELFPQEPLINLGLSIEGGCEATIAVGLLNDRWRHHLSPPPQFRHGTGGEETFSSPLHSWFLLRTPTRLSDSLVLRPRTPCVLRGYLVSSGIEPRPSSLESDALTPRLPTAFVCNLVQSISKTILEGIRKILNNEFPDHCVFVGRFFGDGVCPSR
ncbi:hypothetical protein TNCV_977451 [Trichonephila clavipes]|nr:hypothetical protein TNCV_977451 [Trichonephila clavipes]